MKDMPNKEVLLEEYRQLMESQRDNTRIAYSWIGSIFLVLSSSLFFFGLTTDDLSKFVPAMIMGASVPNVVEKGIGISYPIGKPNKNKGGYTDGERIP
ncbi:MAG: hypothetical protein FJ005_03130 [Chloroflexi bacterium]|nr:hypothetical protein [Chloroflexota bacterium]